MVAESEAAAEDGAELVEVELEPLEPVLDLEAATGPARRARASTERGATARTDLGDAHASVAAGGIGDDGGAVRQRARHGHGWRNGDVDAALAGQPTSSSPAGSARRWVYQGYLEPQSAIGLARARRRARRPQLARRRRSRPATRWPSCSGCRSIAIRVRRAPLGGAFGGKLMIVEPLVAAAALELGRPVRLALTRSEDFAATNPAPGQI